MPKQKDMPIALLILILIKSVVLPVAIFDAVAISILTILFGGKLVLDHYAKPDFNQEMVDMVEANRKYLSEQIDALKEKNHKDLEKIDAKVSGVLLVNTKKPQQSPNFKW